MRELPTGTVSFVFTDIEGSTKLLHKLGDRYVNALAEHRRLLREAFARHGGVEVDTQGDAFFYAFQRASDAAAAAWEAQQALADGPIRVRMGIHTGEATLSDEGYVGMDVHEGARICAVTHGGQVVLSERTRAALEQPDGLVDLGLHRLKDLGQPRKLYQLGDGDFPPLRSLNATNLPVQPNALVGRERELGELTALVREDGRLVTLTGPGGTGKTRRALQAAAELVDDLKEGVVWVPLAAVTEAELVAPTVGATIGASDGLAEHIDEKRMLLLLDNLEQVLPEAASGVAELVSRCPNLRLLATSRALLRVAAECEYEVPPLPDPDAVTLFRERAANTEPEQAVIEICRRLEGLPLAIELAAARTRMLPPDKLLARLERRLPLLAGGARDAPARQQTLRATIEWSYELLSGEERQLFRRLAVFVGGFDVEAAEAIAAAELETLESLVEKSLVRRWASGRLGMLETIREYAVERLEDSGEAEAVRRRHAGHYLAVAESANLSIEALGRGPQRHELVLPEQHNIRAAIDWASEADVELGLRLAVAMENFWITNDPNEGVRRFEALLERADDVDRGLVARALRDYGGSADMAGAYERARDAYTRSGELFREAGDESGAATAVFRLGVLAHVSGDVEQARELYEQSLEIWRRLGDTIGELQALGNLGGLELEHGDPAHGRALVETSLVMAREVGWVWWEAGSVAQLADSALQAGRPDEGERRARECLVLARAIEDRAMTVYALALFAWAAAERGKAERAATLWAAVEREEGKGPIRRWDIERERYAARMPDAPRPVVALELEEAMDYALAED